MENLATAYEIHSLPAPVSSRGYLACSAAEATVLALAAAPALLALRAGASVATGALLFAALVVAWTIALHRLLLQLGEVRPGIYKPGAEGSPTTLWTVTAFLRLCNLPRTEQVPYVLRPLYLRLLGLRTEPGLVSISGHIEDPYLVQLGAAASVGADALLLPHIKLQHEVLVFAPIEVGRGAVIGARSVVLPGVKIGANAVVNACSMVPMYSRIGPGEVWGGIPARKLTPADA